MSTSPLRPKQGIYRFPIIFASLLFVISILLVPGCRTSFGKAQADDETSDEKKDEEAVPVEVAPLTTGTLRSILNFSSTLEAEREVRVLAEAPGKTLEIAVEEGSRVSKGQLLLKIDDELQQNKLRRLEYDLAKAKREYERQQRLHKQGMTSDQILNAATDELEKLKLLEGDAKRELGHTLVRAPIAGTVTGRFVKEGDLVAPNQHLFDIVDFDSLVARVYVPEKELRNLRPGLDAKITAEALGSAVFQGTVERIAPRVDAKSGTVKVTIGIPVSTSGDKASASEGDAGSPPRTGAATTLLPGLFVAVELVTAVHENALLIPKRSLVYDEDQPFVFRLRAKERRVDRLPVTELLSDRDSIEPVEGTFAVGDRIVMAGQASLKDKALVRLPEDKVEKDKKQDRGHA